MWFSLGFRFFFEADVCVENPLGQAAADFHVLTKGRE